MRFPIRFPMAFVLSALVIFTTSIVSSTVFAHPSPGVDQVCAQHPFTDTQVSCMLDLADRFVGPLAETLCK